METLNWRKSSYSGGNGGGCVEVATTSGTQYVRDSKDPDGPRLQASSVAYRVFIEAVKDGRLAK
jgi:Domain of unknown function (DUF397)